MGARNFFLMADASSVSEAFHELVEEARYRHGNDAYNGTISTCQLAGGMKTLSEVYHEKNEKAALQYAENDNFGDKWSAKALDLGVIGYEVISVKKKCPETGKKPEWKMAYCVMACKDGAGNATTINYYPTKKQADEAAMQYASEHPMDDVLVRKQYVNQNQGNTLVTRIETTVKQTKTKPKNTKANVKEIHRYAFYGWAAE